MTTVDENQSLQLQLRLLEARLQRQQKEIQRLEADGALQENLFNSIGAAVFILDTQHRFIEANPAACRLLGTTVDALRGQTCHTVVHCSKNPPEQCPLTAVIQNRQYTTGTMYVESLDRYLWVSCTPVLDDDGEVEKVIHIADDITDQVHLQSQVADSEKRLRTILDALPDMILETDSAHNTIWANHAALAETPDAVGTPCYKSFGSQGTEDACDECVCRQALGSGTMASQVSHRTDTPSHPGESWWHHIGIPLKDPNGQTTRLIKFSRNITQDMLARRDLEASERQFRLLAEYSDDIIWTLDSDGRFIYINPAVKRLLGYEPETLIGQPLSRVLLADSYERAMAEMQVFFERLAAGERDEAPVRLEMAHRCHDGRTVITDVVVNKVFDQQGLFRFFIGASRDITQRLRQEEAIHRANKLDAVGVLAGGLAHDFNNLLSIILGNLEMTTAGNASATSASADPASDSAVDPYIHAAREATLRARDLTHQLLTFAKGGDPVKQPIGLTALIDASLARIPIDAKITTRIDIDSELQEICVDRLQMETALGNLIQNAAEAMVNGGQLNITARSYHLAKRDSVAQLTNGGGHFAKLTIADQGCGIPETMQAKIFDPYYTTKPLGPKKGLGMGLTLAYAVVKKHGGWINVDSVEGQGSCFTLLLPLVAATPRPHSQANVCTTHQRILLMDDEKQLRILCKQMLNHLGYEVETVADGQAAIDAYTNAIDQGEPFGLVILDLTVKAGMGGRDTIRELRRLDADVLAVVSSGYDEDPVMIDPQRFGFATVLPKPFALKDLAALMDTLLPKSLQA